MPDKEASDVSLIRQSLSRLQEPLTSQRNVPKIVELKRGQTKIVCPNHKFRTVIDVSENEFRRLPTSTMEEFECSCGVIYQKS